MMSEIPKSLEFTYTVEGKDLRTHKIKSNNDEIYLFVMSIYEDGYRFFLRWFGKRIVFRAVKECEFDEELKFLKVWWKIESFPSSDRDIPNYEFQNKEEAESAVEIAKSALMKFASCGQKDNFEVVDVYLSDSALRQINFENKPR